MAQIAMHGAQLKQAAAELQRQRTFLPREDRRKQFELSAGELVTHVVKCVNLGRADMEDVTLQSLLHVQVEVISAEDAWGPSADPLVWNRQQDAAGITGLPKWTPFTSKYHYAEMWMEQFLHARPAKEGEPGRTVAYVRVVVLPLPKEQED